jgi:hypothetical protein
LITYGTSSEGDATGKGEFRLIHGGILWAQWLPNLLQAFLWGKPVPKPFHPLRRIAPEIWTRAETLTTQDLGKLFAKLRIEGFLPTLLSLNAKAVSPYFPWQEKAGRSLIFDADERRRALRDYPG